MIANFALAALGAISSPTLVVAQNADESTLHGLNARWLQSYVANDGKALSEILDDRFVSINPRTGARRTKSQIVDDVSKGTYGFATANWRDVQVSVHGDTAIVTGVAEFVRKSGERLENRYLDVYARKGGQWRAVAAEVTRLSPAQ